MRFKFTAPNTVQCNSCGFLFHQDTPQNKEFTVECPECGATKRYWIEWYINELEDEEN